MLLPRGHMELFATLHVKGAQFEVGGTARQVQE